jgi:dihydroflavonol-4-reductase
MEAKGSQRLKVLVTGGTGFVGSHSVKALADAGHDVRLLVRSPARVAPALDPLGVEVSDMVTGDVTDPDAVRSALDGCQAVLHGASVYSFDVREAERMRHANTRGTELVLGTAHELGLDPIVHVSSFVTLLPASSALSPDLPVGRPPGPYNQSKVEAERIARKLQDEGAPVVITYPGSVYGQHDPHMGESARLARDIVRGLVPVRPSGNVPIVDVRDVAAVHAATIEAGRGPRRYLGTGEVVQFGEIASAIRATTGRRLPGVSMPGRLVVGAGRLASAIQRVLPFRLPVAYEPAWLVAHMPPTADDSATTGELGVRFRPAAEAIAGTVRWLHAAGHISDRQAGRVTAASG